MSRQSKRRTDTSRRMLRGRFSGVNEPGSISCSPIIVALHHASRQECQDQSWKAKALELFPD